MVQLLRKTLRFLTTTTSRSGRSKARSGPRQTVLNTRVYKLSEPLSHIVGQDALPRTEVRWLYDISYLCWQKQVTRGIWRYIKEHDLQKKESMRTIKCDGLMKDVFQREEIDMLDIAKNVQSHILGPINKGFGKWIGDKAYIDPY